MDKLKEYKKGIAAFLTPLVIGLTAHYGLALDFDTTLLIISLATGLVVTWVRNKVRIDPAFYEMARKVLAVVEEAEAEARKEAGR